MRVYPQPGVVGTFGITSTPQLLRKLSEAIRSLPVIVLDLAANHLACAKETDPPQADLLQREKARLHV